MNIFNKTLLLARTKEAAQILLVKRGLRAVFANNYCNSNYVTRQVHKPTAIYESLFYLFNFTFLWFLPLTASPLSFSITSIVSSPLYVAARFSEKPAVVKKAQLKKK